MAQIPPDPELKAIESALGELVPRSSRLDRDKLMFEAGAISSRRANRRGMVWPSLTAVLGLVICGESLLLSNRPAPRVVERVVFVPAPAAPAIASSGGAGAGERTGGDELAASEERRVGAWPAASDYQRFQALVMRFGLDAIQEPSLAARSVGGDGLSGGAGLAPAGALRSIELQKILKPGDAL